jgi:hypothetical protein
MSSFEEIDLCNLASHPLAGCFYDLMQQIECLPADTRQTDLVIDLINLRAKTSALINNADFKVKIDAQTRGA